jgi:alcohol dehydrogenase class IV
MRQEAQKHPDRLAMIAQAEGQDSKGMSQDKLALTAAERVEDLALSKRLSDCGIKKEDLPSIAKDASAPGEYSTALQVLEAIF